MKLTIASIGNGLRIGTVLRLMSFGPARAPTLLIIYSRSTKELDLALGVIGGHKRGSTLLLFPQSSYVSSFGISRDWLVRNWTRWIDPDSRPDDVEVILDLLADFPHSTMFPPEL